MEDFEAVLNTWQHPRMAAAHPWLLVLAVALAIWAVCAWAWSRFGFSYVEDTGKEWALVLAITSAVVFVLWWIFNPALDDGHRIQLALLIPAALCMFAAFVAPRLEYVGCSLVAAEGARQIFNFLPHVGPMLSHWNSVLSSLATTYGASLTFVIGVLTAITLIRNQLR